MMTSMKNAPKRRQNPTYSGVPGIFDPEDNPSGEFSRSNSSLTPLSCFAQFWQYLASSGFSAPHPGQNISVDLNRIIKIFGFIVGIVSAIYFLYFGSTSSTPIVEEYIRVILDIFVFPVICIIMSCIIGLVAVLWGWIFNRVFTYFQT